MTDQTPPQNRDKLWTAIIVGLVVVGILIAVGGLLITSSIGFVWPSVQVLLVAIIVAAIRSRK